MKRNAHQSSTSSIFRPLSLAGLSPSSVSPNGASCTAAGSRLTAAGSDAGGSATPPSLELGDLAELVPTPAPPPPMLVEPALPQEVVTDLGDDDDFDPAVVSGYITDMPARLSVAQTANGASSVFTGLPPSPPPDVDHRKEAIFDELDDLDGWAAPGAHPVSGGSASVPDLGRRLTRGLDRIAAGKTVAVHERTETRRRENHSRDKNDRATVELVLDPRTRMVLFKLLSRGRLRTLDGCVSTGKEANVYYGTAAANASTGMLASRSALIPRVGLLPEERSPDAPVAVKVYKTSILQFKDRERYVAGEFRFRRGGYNRSSNRKMVQQWAEKEYRNLVRLQEADIPCPVPLLLKQSVLVMSFFGRDGWPAPLLKDASLSGSRVEKAYFRVCVLMRRMFHVARLVHGDLSEYNMLFWNSEVIIIDVSQSVEHDHPMALDFLRRDCQNVNEFFNKNGVVVVLGLRELFDFVTGTSQGRSEAECAVSLRALLDEVAVRDERMSATAVQDDNVFMHSYIPRTLQDVQNHEAEIEAVVRDGPDAVLYGKLTGLSAAQTDKSMDNAINKSSRQKDPPKRLSNTPRPVRRQGTSGFEPSMFDDEGENNLGFPTMDLDEENFDDVSEPIATKLPNIGSKSSKSNSSSASPRTPQARIVDLQQERNMMRHFAASDSGTTDPSSSAQTNPDSDPTPGEPTKASLLDLGRRGSRAEPAASNRLSSITQRLQELSTGALPRVFAGRGADWSADVVDEGRHSDQDASTFDLRHPDIVASDSDEGAEDLQGMTRKEWKKHVKAEARERRENKTPKHVKKRKEALAKRRRGTKTKK